MRRPYWFTEDAKQIADKMSMHHGEWLRYGSNPVVQAWMRNSVAYYSNILEANDWQSSLAYVGELGELVKMAVPQARSLIRQIVTLVTKQRLSFTAIAEASGTDIMRAVKLANALNEKLVVEQRLDLKQEVAAEQACVYGMGFFKVSWRTDRGTPYISDSVTYDDGRQMDVATYDGDVEITTPSVYDVYFDTRVQDWDALSWVEVRTIKNRWDLIAQHPEIEEEIASLPRVGMREKIYDNAGMSLVEDDDMIYVYEVYHKPCPAIPSGRMVMYSDSRTIYFDGPNKYGCIPVVPIKPEPIHMMGYGYPVLSNLLPCQEMFDHSLSAIATNQSATAVQQVLTPRGSDISVQDIGGLNFVYYTPQNVEGGGKPEPMQLTQSPPETFKFAEVLKGHMLEISNLNSAVRGAPPPGVTSGTAIATLTANSLEFLSSLSKSLDIALEQVMLISCKAHAQFSTTERTLAVTAKNNMAYSYKFSGKDIEPIKKVKINRSSPLMGTIAGRSDIAEKLLQTGLIKTPQQYFRIIEGAPTEELYKVELSETDLQTSENEAFLRGEDVLALATDDHPAHIQFHNSLLNDPEIRRNGEIVAKVLEHIQEHYQLAQQTDPILQGMVRTGKMPEGGFAPQPPPPVVEDGGASVGAVMGEETLEPALSGPAPVAADQLGRPVSRGI